MGGIIVTQKIGTPAKIKYKYKPKAKLPKKTKAPTSNSPKNLHRKDPVTGVSQKKPVSLSFAKVLTEEQEPLLLTPKFHIEAKLFGTEFSFWGKIPTLIRYVILKTEFIKSHKGTLSTEDTDRLLKTAAHLERLVGAILNQSLPGHQLIMLEPFANLTLMPAISLLAIEAQLKQLSPEQVANKKAIIESKKWLALLIKKQSIEHYAMCYQSLFLLANGIGKKEQQEVLKYALYIQVQGLSKLKNEFTQQWQRALKKGTKRQSIILKLKVNQALPLFNFEDPKTDWHLKFEAIVSNISSEKLKILFRFSAGSSSERMLPLQVRGECLLSGRHVKYFKDHQDATDYLACGFLLNLCQPFSGTQQTDFKRLKNQLKNQHRTLLSSNLKLQQQITHQASKLDNEITGTEKTRRLRQYLPLQCSIHHGWYFDFSKFLDAERITAPLLNQLIQEPLRLACRNPQYFSVKIPHRRFGLIFRKGDLGFKWAKNITKRISYLIDTLEAQTEMSEPNKEKLFSERQKIKQAITALNAEYHAYLNVVKQFDSVSVTNYPEYREIKLKFENDRGAKCRAEYLRAVICTHALLVLAYHHSLSAKCDDLNKPEINFCRYLSRLSQEYEYPDCHLVKEKANCYLTMTSVLQGSQIEKWQQANLAIELANASIHQGIVVQRTISDDLDPNMDGEYLDIKLFISGSENPVQQTPQWFSEVLQQLFVAIKLESLEVNLIGLPEIDEISIGSDTQIVIQFKKCYSQHYDLQFVRIYDTANQNHHYREYASCSSLTYWLTKYNACSDGYALEEWQGFCHSNQSALEYIFNQIILPNSYIANEVEVITSQFENQSSKRNLYRAILQWKKDNSLFPQALAAFDEFLSAQNQCHQSKILSRLSVLKARLER